MILLAASTAAAAPCTGESARGTFVTCFDPGNRLSVTAATDGFGGALALRHEIHFVDEPDLVWKLEHVFFDTTYDGFRDDFDGTLYKGRFFRHARNGHIVLPFGDPKGVFLHSDIGAIFEVGHLSWRGMDPASFGIVKTALLTDVTRSKDFRTHLAIGPVGSWDVDLTPASVKVANHRIAPFSAGLVELHLESDDGLSILNVRGEAGTAWHTTGQWHPFALGEADLERIVLAINDRPIALYGLARYDSARSEATAAIGVRIVLVAKTDQRVSRL